MIISVLYSFVSLCLGVLKFPVGRKRRICWAEARDLADGSGGCVGRKGRCWRGAFYNGKDTAKFVDSQKWGIDNLQKFVKENGIFR